MDFRTQILGQRRVHKHFFKACSDDGHGSFQLVRGIGRESGCPFELTVS